MSFRVTNLTQTRSAEVLIGETAELSVNAGDVVYFSGSGWEPYASVEVFKGDVSIFNLQTDEFGGFQSGSYPVSSHPPLSEPTQVYVLYNGYDGAYGDSGVVNLVSAPVQVTVYFEKIGAGTTQPSGAQNFDLGEVVSVTASPSADSTFIRWEFSLDGVNYAPVEWLPASGGSIIANDGEYWRAVFGTFVTLTVNITPSGSGSVAQRIGGVNTTSPYLLGDIVMLTAYPHLGYEFTGWSGSLTGSTNPTTIIMNANKTVLATFTKTQYTLDLRIAGTGGGTINVSPSGGVYDLNTVVTVQAFPDSESEFTNWSGNLSGSVNPTTITMTGDKLVTAVFTLQSGGTYTLTAKRSPVEGGTLNVLQTSTHDAGSVVNVIATPAVGYTFVRWTGASTATTPSINVTMNANKAVTAYFEGGGGDVKTKSVVILTNHKLTVPIANTTNDLVKTLSIPFDPLKTTIMSVSLEVDAISDRGSMETNHLINGNDVGVISWDTNDASVRKSNVFDLTGYWLEGENDIIFSYHLTWGVILLPASTYINATIVIEYTGEEPNVEVKKEPWELEWWQWGLIGVGGIVIGYALLSRGGKGGGVTIIRG